jgi:hypothetical protein
MYKIEKNCINETNHKSKFKKDIESLQSKVKKYEIFNS